MTLACKKIYGVDKSICTCEQKIAYNFASMWLDIGKKILSTDNAEFVKDEAIQDIYNSVSRSIKENKEINGHYNLDAIMIAFRQGFRRYCETHFIAHDYKTIGECFRIPYKVV